MRNCHKLIFLALPIESLSLYLQPPAPALRKIGMSNNHPTRMGFGLRYCRNKAFEKYTMKTGRKSILFLKENEEQEDGVVDEVIKYTNHISRLYSIMSILSTLAWLFTSYVALSFHPDPKFTNCSMRHNILTMGQAFAFPLPIMIASFHALSKNACAIQSNIIIGVGLNAIVSFVSFGLAASSAFAPSFAFGYDLYSIQQKVVTSIVHVLSGILSSVEAWKILQRYRSAGTQDESILSFEHRDLSTSLYFIGSFSMLYFAIQPFFVSYPLVTIPTILGKRLSRPASIFTFLGSGIAYILGISSTRKNVFSSVRESLRLGLQVGTGSHIFLLILKLIGVDGGGLILKGRGLWEVYPAMMSAPFATGVSLGVFAILHLATWYDSYQSNDS